jgi:predicted extracellular nuclease
MTDLLLVDCELYESVVYVPTALPFETKNGTFTCGEAGEPGIADHVVISEVQISGATAKDEFVELYNPTNAPVSLNGWYLTKKTASGSTERNLLAGFPATSIPAHGFFLITHQSNYTGSVVADATYNTTNSTAADNTVILYSDNKITVVDKVGFGAAMDNETLSYPGNPGDNKSLQRKINATIKEGGYGPAWDTGNNSADFFIQTSNPRNSATSLPPIPELSTLMLLTSGLVTLVGYVIVKKGRKG